MGDHLDRIDLLQLTSDLPSGDGEHRMHGRAHIHRIGRAVRDEDSLQLLLQATCALWRTHKHDLFHGFYAVYSGYVATLAARQCGGPAVVSLRGNDLDVGMFQGSRAPFLQWTLIHADALTVVAQEMIQRIRALVGRKQAIHFIGNSVDSEHFCPGVPDEDTTRRLEGNPRPWVGFSGELRFKKGLPVLQSIAEHFAESGKGTVITLGAARSDERQTMANWRMTHTEGAARLIEIP